MPRKKFEDTPYDPIAADLAREVGATGRAGGSPTPLSVVELRTEKHQSVGSAAFKIEHAHVTTPTLKPKVPEATATKRFIVTRSEEEDLTAFFLRLQKKTGTKITLSVFARAALGVAMQAEEQILAEIGDSFSMELPSTQDSIGQAEYQDRLMNVLTSAFRKMPRPGRV